MNMTRREPIPAKKKRGIFDRTRGKCHICHKQLAFKNHGVFGARGAWHVEHSIAVANGGTNHGNNLFAACITCNIEKCTVTSRTARSWAGTRRAPLPAHRYEEAKSSAALSGAFVFAGIGGLFGGPPGAVVGGLVGLVLGYESNPDA